MRLLWIVLGVALAVAGVWVLFTLVFPWVDQMFLTDPVMQ